MRLTASDLHSYYRPSQCDLRVFLRQRDEREEPIGPYEKVLQRLGERHEKAHLASLGPCVDLSDTSIEQRIERTRQEVSRGSSVIYRPVLRTSVVLNDDEDEIVGVPDFMLLSDGERYIVRDSKISRRINDDDHPEILRQMELYGWLYQKTFGVPPAGLQVHAGTGTMEPIVYDGGAQALQILGKIALLNKLSSEPHSPVGWTKCGNCGFSERCWPLAESRRDPALLADVDQNLAAALYSEKVKTFEDLLARFDEATLAEFKRPWGKKVQKVVRAGPLLYSGWRASWYPNVSLSRRRRSSQNLLNT